MKTVLVVANETIGGQKLVDAIRSRAAEGDARFVLCVPQNRPKAGLVIYDEAVFDAAQARVDLALSFMHAEGFDAIGEVGDPDPYTATMDAVHAYHPREIIISTYPATRSGWLRRDLVERVREASGLPVEHIVADPDTEGLPFHVTLAVANRTASGDELFEALKAKVEAEPERERGRLFIVKPYGLLGFSHFPSSAAGTGFNPGTNALHTGGVDIKLGLRSNLVVSGDRIRTRANGLVIVTCVRRIDLRRCPGRTVIIAIRHETV